MGSWRQSADGMNETMRTTAINNQRSMSVVQTRLAHNRATREGKALETICS
jgi:hypothetical protein